VSDVLFLDSGPLGLITQPQRSSEVIAITDWLKDCLLAGARVLVPAIVYYEIKRELLRANKSVGIARLDAFVNATPDRYLPLTDDALRFGAELWAQSRRAGRPTAEAAALDIDCTTCRAGSRFRPSGSRRDYKPETPGAICPSTALDGYRPFDVCAAVKGARHRPL
jgi:predicted nucleic acid-binding protein